ncbi:MAG: ABC transporter permease subunit [Actinomycetales bacterium]|nr:ABC transporter permease subunit [Actinomycetales bacterium]
MTTRTSPAWLGWAWVLPAGFLLAFLAVPVTVILRHAVGSWGTAGLSVADARGTWAVALLAAAQATASTLLAVAVGLPIANVVSRYRFRGRSLVMAFVTIPFVLPTVVVALALRQLIGPGLGPGLLLVIIAHAYVNLAVVVRIVGSQWHQLDPRAESIARTLGAGALQAFWTVTLPRLRPAIASAAAVVFTFCFTSLGIVLILGDASTRTLEQQVLRQTSVLLDFPGAAASALVQLIVVSAVLLLGTGMGRLRPTSLQASRLLPLPQRTVPRLLVLLVAVVASLLVLAPVVALVVGSLRTSGGWSLQWWVSIGSVDAGTTRIGSPIDALATSIRYALVTAVIAAAVGGLAALAVLSHRTGRALAIIALAPLGISAATIGLGTLLTYGRPPWDLRGTGLLVPIAHALVAVPLVVAVVMPALRLADGRAAHVAATLGARPTRAFLTAYGPILGVVMLAGAGLAAATSLGEFGAASFLAREGAPTVPVQIARLLSRPGEQSLGSAGVLAVILVIATLGLVMLVDGMGRRMLTR